MSLIECCGVIFDADKIVAIQKDEMDGKSFLVHTLPPTTQRMCFGSIERRDEQFAKFLNQWTDSKKLELKIRNGGEK